MDHVWTSRIILDHFGSLLDNFGQVWIIFKLFLNHFESFLHRLWTTFGPFWIILNHFGSFLNHFESFWINFGSVWTILDHFDLFWTIFGSFLEHCWSILTFWNILDHFGSFLDHSESLLHHFRPFMNYFWTIFGPFLNHLSIIFEPLLSIVEPFDAKNAKYAEHFACSGSCHATTASWETKLTHGQGEATFIRKVHDPGLETPLRRHGRAGNHPSSASRAAYLADNWACQISGPRQLQRKINRRSEIFDLWVAVFPQIRGAAGPDHLFPTGGYHLSKVGHGVEISRSDPPDSKKLSKLFLSLPSVRLGQPAVKHGKTRKN